MKNDKNADRQPIPMLLALSGAVLAAVMMLLSAMVGASPALAQGTVQIDVLEDVATIIDFDGYYDSSGEDIARLEDLTDRAIATGDNWYFVSLTDEPVGGPSVYAGQLAELLPDSGTIIVVNPYEENGEIRLEAGTWSADYNTSQINAGEDLAFDALFGTDPGAADVAEAMFDGISSQTKTDPSTDPGASSDSGGGINAAWLLVPVGIGGAAYFGNRYWQGRKADQRDEEDVDAAKKEIKDQLDAVANYVIGQADYVELAENEQATKYYEEATATFTAVDDELKRTDDLLELAKLNDKIDLARWQMEAAEAIIEEREVPPKPSLENPVACFFDPTHRPGVKLVTIKTAAGSKEVRVCPDDAAKLARGEKPQPRMIDVHGRRIPAAKAPRSHGGLGMGGIDFFDILLGGGSVLGRPTGTRTRRQRAPSPSFPWDWNNGRATRPKPRSSGGVFGPDRLPRSRQSTGRPGRPRNTSRPKRRTTGRRASRGRSRKRF